MVVGERGRGLPDVGDVLRCSGAGIPVIWAVEVVYVPRIGRTLGGLHHRVDHILMGCQPWRGLDGMWMYPHFSPGEGDGRGGPEGGGYLRHPLT